MMAKVMRAAIYLRVSTGEQTVENQRRDLEAAATQRGWIISATYADEGISGSKGRDKRPGLDAMLKDATRGKFDVVMAWAVNRMGRSLPDLIGTMQELHAAKVDVPASTGDGYHHASGPGHVPDDGGFCRVRTGYDRFPCQSGDGTCQG
jgi:DNA invertase Pin-like site-specific DNA recombinase